MSNDITALMGTMKASAARAAAAISDYECGRIDVLEKRLAVEEYEKLVSEPANVLALVEALEARDKQIVELEKSRKSWRELADDAEKMRKSWADIAIEMGKQGDDKDKRIAALGSRTVTVKLTKRTVGEVMHMSGFNRDYAEGWCSGNDNAINEMKLAGIQVIEGEGQ